MVGKNYLIYIAMHQKAGGFFVMCKGFSSPSFVAANNNECCSSSISLLLYYYLILVDLL